MFRASPTRRTIVAAASFLLLLGCSGESGNGQLSLFVTDAPIDDLDAVVVHFKGVELRTADDMSLELAIDPPRSIDLLSLAGGGSEAILDHVTVPAGSYQWLRLVIGAENDQVYDSYVVTREGAQYELVVPSGQQTGLKLVHDFVVPADGHPSFTIDFDLRKSVTAPSNTPGSYKLRPTLRIVDNTQVGTIEGKVAPELVTGMCSPAVYVFSGFDTEPDDLDGVEPEAVTVAVPTLDTSTGTYDYRAAFLNPGPYTTVFMCNAVDDRPDRNDSLNFGEAKNATVDSADATTVDFGN